MTFTPPKIHCDTASSADVLEYVHARTAHLAVIISVLCGFPTESKKNEKPVICESAPRAEGFITITAQKSIFLL